MKTALLSATLVMMMSWFDDNVGRDAFPEFTLRLSVNTGQQFVVKPEIKLVRGNDARVVVVDRSGESHALIIHSALENGRTVLNLRQESGRFLMDIGQGNNSVKFSSASGVPIEVSVEYRA